MLHVAIKSLRAHKRRLFTTGFAIILGVAFMSGTLVLSDTLDRAVHGLINDALVGVQKTAEALVANQARVKALREYARLSRLRFENGTASYLDVLYADNELFSAELAAVSANSDRAVQLISVYKALGGGWVDAVDPQTTGKATEDMPAGEQPEKQG